MQLSRSRSKAKFDYFVRSLAHKKKVLAEHGSPLMMNRDLAAYELIGRRVARQMDRKGGPIDLIRRDINFSTVCVNYFTRNV